MAVIISKEITVPKGPVKGTLGSDLAIGSSVKLNVNGILKEFLIVHQGLPSSMYDASCDGVWLLMKDIYEDRAWHSSNDSAYASSTIHQYLNGTFLGLLDSEVQTIIKRVKIPYCYSSDGTVYSGANGLSTSIFLLSGKEVNGSATSGYSYLSTEGACLSYFSSDSVRVGYLNGLAQDWWLRSRYVISTINTYRVWYVNSSGKYENTGYPTYTRGIRPAMILPSNSLFDPDTMEFVGVA